MRAGGAEKARKGYCMLGSLGCDRDFLGRNRASGSVSGHGSHAKGCCRVATGVFLVATELFFSYFSIVIGFHGVVLR